MNTPMFEQVREVHSNITVFKHHSVQTSEWTGPIFERALPTNWYDYTLPQIALQRVKTKEKIAKTSNDDIAGNGRS